MTMETTVTLTGAKRFKDTVEGKLYDSTTIYCLLGMDTSTGDAAGQAGTEYKWGLSDNFAKIQPLLAKGPFRAVLTLEQVTNGKLQKTICLDVRPVSEPVKG